MGAGSMWQSDGKLIQVEIGEGIAKAFTEQNQRGIIGRVFEDSPKEAKVLLDTTNYLRESLKQEGICLPTINYQLEEKLEYNEFRAYIGLESYQFNIGDRNELLNFIVQKVREYNTVEVNEASLDALLANSLEDVIRDNYQRAFRTSSIVYYHSILQNYELETIRSLSDAGSILLECGDFQRSLTLFTRASLLNDSPSIVDPIIKMQVNFNLAEALKNIQAIDKSLIAYMNAGFIAYYSGHFSHLFLALINIANNHYLLGNYAKAIFALEQADELILDDEKPDFSASRNLQKTISEIKSILILQQNKQIQLLNEKLKGREINLFLKSILMDTFSVLAKSGVQLFAYKTFGMEGYPGFALFGMFDFKRATFVKSQVGNSNIMNNLQKAIGNG
jgi:tetratricopeptide (TPR) repeat protein